MEALALWRQLPALPKLLVSVLAVQEGPLSRTELAVAGRDLAKTDHVGSWTAGDVSDLLRASEQAGLVENSGPLDMAPHLREPIIRDLLGSGQYWVVLARAAKAKPLDARRDWRGFITYLRIGCLRRELRSVVYAGDLERYCEIEHIVQELSVAEMVLDPLETDVIARCHGALRIRVLRDLCTLRCQLHFVIPGLMELLRESIPRRGTPANAEEAEVFALLAQERLLAGDLAEARDLLPHFSDIRHLRDIESLVELAAGNIRAADRACASWLAWFRQYWGSNQVVPETLAGTFLPLIYLLRGTEQRRKQALRLLGLSQQATAEDGLGLRSGWQALSPLVDQGHRRVAYPLDPWHPASVLIEAL
ncbi:MAG: hypothetical protein GXP62_06860, partial [Oligoflexia bacterium]|nr:hypothetical protein [Oligoflexia bacterium]